jgi:hypothetical protein
MTSFVLWDFSTRILNTHCECTFRVVLRILSTFCLIMKILRFEKNVPKPVINVI